MKSMLYKLGRMIECKYLFAYFNTHNSIWEMPTSVF